MLGTIETQIAAGEPFTKLTFPGDAADDWAMTGGNRLKARGPQLLPTATTRRRLAPIRYIETIGLRLSKRDTRTARWGFRMLRSWPHVRAA